MQNFNSERSEKNVQISYNLKVVNGNIYLYVYLYSYIHLYNILILHIIKKKQIGRYMRKNKMNRNSISIMKKS